MGINLAPTINKIHITMKRFLLERLNRYNRECTHTSMSGGTYHIPDTDTELMINTLVEEVRIGRKFYLLESQRKKIRFYMDLDFKFEQDPNIDFDIMFDFFMGNTNHVLEPLVGIQRSVILSSPPKESNGKIKYGFHVIFPTLLTTPYTATILSQIISSYLNYICFYGIKNWKTSDKKEGINDLEVYRNGLRMPFSIKQTKCKNCQNKEPYKQHCEICDGKGTIDENRPYTLYRAYTGQVYGKSCEEKYCTSRCNQSSPICKLPRAIFDEITIKSYEENTHLFLEDVLIRNVNQDQNVFTVNNIEYPPFFDFHMEIKKKYIYFTKHDFLVEEEKNLKEMLDVVVLQDRCKKNEEIIEPGTEIFRIIEKIIQRIKMYKDIRIRTVKKNTTSKGQISYISYTEETFCENIMKSHNNATVYFVINKKGCMQKCNCKCSKTEDRVSGKPCSKYTGSVHKIPPIYEDKLFDTLHKHMQSSKLSIFNSPFNIVDDKSKLYNRYSEILEYMEKEIFIS